MSVNEGKGVGMKRGEVIGIVIASISAVLTATGIFTAIYFPEIRAAIDSSKSASPTSSPASSITHDANEDELGGGVTQSSTGSDSGSSTGSNTSSPGTLRFYDAGIDPNSTYPSAFRLPQTPPIVRAEHTTNSGSNLRAIKISLSNLGISRVNVTIKDPSGSVVIETGELVTVQPEMSLTYEISSSATGNFTVTAQDTKTGLSSQTAIQMDRENFPPGAAGVPIGSSPHLSIGTPTGKACDAEGAVVPIVATQVQRGTGSLKAALPTGVVDALGTQSHDYSGIVDDWGNAYYAVIIKADNCTGQSITGLTATLGDASIGLSVPN